MCKENFDEEFISTHIKAGTPIPYTEDYDLSMTGLKKQRYTAFRVYEAIKTNPDENKVSEDYREIMSVVLDHESEVPKGTKCESRLTIDQLGVLTIEARAVDKPGKPSIKKSQLIKKRYQYEQRRKFSFIYFLISMGYWDWYVN